MKNNKEFILNLDLKKKIHFKNGFTLIELLVVIAIIGVLSSIVYVSLDSARGKSKDTAVLSHLSSMKLQAEIYYDQRGKTYLGVCGTASASFGFGGVGGPGLLKKTQESTGIVSKGPIINNQTIGNWETVTCHDSDLGWAVEAPTSKSEDNNSRMFCIDNKNLVKETTNNLGANSIICP